MMTVIRKNQLIAIMIVVVLMIIGYLGYKGNQTLPVIDEISDPLLTEKLESSVMLAQNDEDIIEDVVVNAPVANNVETFFAETRLERDRVRDEEVFMQEMILNSNNVSSDLHTKAQEQLTAIGNRSEKELIVESLIKAKGFNDAICFINNDNINVIIKNGGKELDAAQSAQIKEVVKSEIGDESKDLRIVVK